MALRHFESVTSKSDGGFCVASSALTGNSWNGTLWYFDNWEHYQHVPNIDMYAVHATDGIADIKWYDDSKLIVGMDNGTLEVWSLVAPGNELEKVGRLDKFHDEMVLCVGVTSDGEGGKSVISGGGDGRVILNDLACEKILGTFKGHVGWVTSLDIHPTVSKMFVTVGMDSRLKIWDIRNPFFVTSNIGPSDVSSQGYFQSVSWSPLNENLIASGSASGYLCLYDTRNVSSPLLNLHSHTRSIHRILFSTIIEGVVATGSEDCSVQMYDIDRRQVLFSNNSHNDFVHGLSWQKDFFLLSCGWDGKVYRHSVREGLDLSQDPITKTTVEIELLDSNNEITKDAGGRQPIGSSMDSTAAIKAAATNDERMEVGTDECNSTSASSSSINGLVTAAV